MQKLLTNLTISSTELRRNGLPDVDEPVAILNQNVCVGYYYPVNSIQPTVAATLEEVIDVVVRRKDTLRPIIDQLAKDD